MARVEEQYTAHARSMNSKGEITSVQVDYIVFDVYNEQEALQAVFEFAPKDINGVGLYGIDISDRLDDTTFTVSASYDTDSSSSDEDEEEPTLSFSCGGGTMHLTEAYEQESLFGKNDAGKLINWNFKKGEEFEAAGVDVTAPNFRETYTKKMSPSKLTTKYRRTIGQMVGKVNSNKFKGWEPGEVMFENISFSAPTNGSNKKVLVSFEFTIRPNEKNFSFAGKKVSKYGFDYLWARQGMKKSSGANSLAPKNAYKARVFQFADFSVLGL